MSSASPILHKEILPWHTHIVCFWCWAPASMRCDSCKCATYCSKVCATAHWKQGKHKQWCKVPLVEQTHGISIQHLYHCLRQMSSLVDHVPGPGNVRIFISVGCGLAEAELALVAMHQSNPQRQWAWGWQLVDPEPTCFQIRQQSGQHMTAPCLPMALSTIHDRPTKDWQPWMQQVLLLNWPDRSSQYDFVALKCMKPRACAIVYDSCAGAGSAPLHALLASWDAPHSHATVKEAYTNPEISRELEVVQAKVKLSLVHKVSLLMKSSWTVMRTDGKDESEDVKKQIPPRYMWNSIALACVVSQSIVDTPTLSQRVVLDLLHRWSRTDPELTNVTQSDIYANNNAYVAWQRAQNPEATNAREMEESTWEHRKEEDKVTLK